MNKTDNRYAINEEEQKKILNDIVVGVWRIELIPEQMPQMYGDTNMYTIMGADLRLCPEQLYQYWHARIDSGYLTYVDKAVKRLLMTGQPIEVEYIWNHPQFGRTVVRCDATLSSTQEEDRIVMFGLHRDITDKIQNNVWEEEGDYIIDYYKMSLCGKHLTRAYEDILLVDADTKASSLIACKRNHCPAVTEGGSILEVIGKCVFPEDREKICELFSDESMKRIVESKEAVSVEFRRGADCGRYQWLKGTLYPMQINENDEILFVVQDRQNEYKLKMLKEEKEDILYSVINERAVICEYNVESDCIQILKHDIINLIPPDVISKMSLVKLVQGLCTNYVDRSEWEKVQDLLSLEKIRRCVEKKCKKVVSLPLDTERFQYDWMKLSVLPSSNSKTKVYLLMELMERREILYPLVESYIRHTTDYFYCLDLKKDYFFQLVGGTKKYGMFPEEGDDYTQKMLDYVEQFVVEEDMEIVKKKMSPEFVLKELENQQEFSFSADTWGKHGEIRRKLFTYRSFELSKGYVFLQRTDITDLHHKNQLLKKTKQELMRDSLTKLYNRSGSEKMIKKALSELEEDNNAALIMLDLDNFKAVNDKFGHPVGDQVLCEVAQRLKECFRAEDIVGRLGGDEYIIFLPHMRHKIDIHPVLKRLVEKLNIVWKSGTESVTVTASVGAVFCGKKSYEELYKEADEALYYSKKEKNRYSLFEDRK